MQFIVRVGGNKIEGLSGRREAEAEGNILVSAKKTVRQREMEDLVLIACREGLL